MKILVALSLSILLVAYPVLADSAFSPSTRASEQHFIGIGSARVTIGDHAAITFDDGYTLRQVLITGGPKSQVAKFQIASPDGRKATMIVHSDGTRAEAVGFGEFKRLASESSSLARIALEQSSNFTTSNRAGAGNDPLAPHLNKEIDWSTLGCIGALIMVAVAIAVMTDVCANPANDLPGGACEWAVLGVMAAELTAADSCGLGDGGDTTIGGGGIFCDLCW